MTLSISSADLAVVSGAENELLLGIIERDGAVRFKVGGRNTCPGHTDWLRLDGLMDAHRGFSLIVKHGRVDSLHRRSEVNPADIDFALELDLTEELLSMLPCIAGVKTYPRLGAKKDDDFID